MLVFVGTGSRTPCLEAKKVLDMRAVALAGQSVLSIMADCDWLNQTILQWLSCSPTAWPIDSEIDRLDDDVLGGGEPLLHHLRYNVRFERDWLQRELNLAFADAEINSLFAMDQPKNVKKLAELGIAAGLAQVKAEHFPATFDLFQ